jgi:putative transposase
MARISRIVVPHYPHHVTQRGVRSISVFHADDDRRRYLEFLSEEIDRFGVNILAWCLMTNHVHFIAVPIHETGLARAFGETHRRYTRMKNFEEGVRGYLFQGRFSSVVLDERHLMAAARYVELNPVRAGMVGQAWEYAWSSAGFHSGVRAVDPLVKEKTLPTLAGNWLEFLSGGDEKEMNVLRMATRTGRPAGDEVFIAELSKIAGKIIMRGRPGRPRKEPGQKPGT